MPQFLLWKKQTNKTLPSVSTGQGSQALRESRAHGGLGGPRLFRGHELGGGLRPSLHPTASLTLLFKDHSTPEAV